MKTIKLALANLAFIALCVAVFYSIKEDNLKDNAEHQKQKTIDSFFGKMDSINKYLGSCRYSTQYWSNRLTNCNFQNKEWNKYLLFSDRNAKRFTKSNEEFRKLDSIFNKVNK